MKQLIRLTILFCACAALALTVVAGPEPLPSGKEMKQVAPAPLPECNWTGFYIGLNVGGQFGHAENTDVDGYNLAYAVTHETFEDVVEYLVPELQRRGAYPTAYREGTLREKLFGGGAYLPESHPAHRYRDIERVKREEALASARGSLTAAE